MKHVVFGLLCLCVHRSSAFSPLSPRSLLPTLPSTSITTTVVSESQQQKPPPEEIIDSRTLSHEILQHRIDHILVSSDLTKIISETVAEDVRITDASPFITSKIMDQAFQNNVLVEVGADPKAWMAVAGSVLQGFLYLPLLYFGYNVFVGFSRIASRGAGMFQRPGSGTGNGMSGMPGMPGMPSNPFGSSSEEDNDIVIEPVRLEDWAGSPEVLRECSEIVSYLKDRRRFLQMGAKIPKGILLDGPPGTGKTLLAKAIATEANATFISMSGSEFVEMFVGLGAARVRELFKDARKQKPSILFIDEIDAVGRQRGTGINMGNDEREQTLNQLLAEMDGFRENDDIIVLAATNRRDVLDAALLRPGRFDRLVNVPLPDYDSRVKILEVHARRKNLNRTEINLQKIGQQTGGYSGAGLQNLLNEAALLAVRKNETMISKASVNEALEKLMVGIQKEVDTRSVETKRLVAIHEAGHAVIALLFPEYFNFVKVTIQNTYSGAGGYTIFTDKTETVENGLYSKDYLKKRLRVLLGGRAAESLFYGDDFVTVGAREDLRQAALLSRNMITQYGMGEHLENYCNPYDNNDTPFMGRMLGSSPHHVSEDLAASVDKESRLLIKEAYQETRKLLKEKEGLMNTIISGLMEKKTLYPEDIVKV